MQDISCADCPWHDTRPSTNSALSTCDNCGGDRLAYADHQDEIPPGPESPVIVPAP